jgi:hypothetical protein
MTIVKYLPIQPSELLNLTVTCLVEIQNDDRYYLSDDHWHHPEAKKTLVSLSGCVMAKVLDADINTEFSPDEFRDLNHDLDSNVRRDYDYGVYHCLKAIDVIEHGNVGLFFSHLNQYKPKRIPDTIWVPVCGDDQLLFVESLSSVLQDLANKLSVN